MCCWSQAPVAELLCFHVGMDNSIFSPPLHWKWGFDISLKTGASNCSKNWNYPHWKKLLLKLHSWPAGQIPKKIPNLNKHAAPIKSQNHPDHLIHLSACQQRMNNMGKIKKLWGFGCVGFFPSLVLQVSQKTRRVFESRGCSAPKHLWNPRFKNLDLGGENWIQVELFAEELLQSVGSN